MQDKHSDLDTAVVWRYNIPFDLDEENDHDDTEAPNFPTLSLYKEATAGYIALYSGWCPKRFTAQTV